MRDARRWWGLVLAAGVAACGAPASGRSTAAAVTAADLDARPPDGELLERRPCPVPADHAALVGELAPLAADVEQAGLADELAARPLAALFPPADHERLAAASAAGRCERVVYRSGDLRVVGFVVRPAGAVAGPRPVVLWLRGGSRDFGRIGSLGLLWMLDLADAAFVVVASQYRGADGGEGHDEYGGADVDDVLALVPLARRLPDADVSRLYVVGGSRGAMQGLLAIRRGLPARAAALRGGLYDLPATLAERPQLAAVWSELIPGWADEATRARALADRSPVQWAAEVRVPVLLGHGRQDWRAPLAQTEAFVAALPRLGASPRLVVYEREEHQLLFHRAEWTREIVAWFRQHGAFSQPR